MGRKLHIPVWLNAVLDNFMPSHLVSTKENHKVVYQTQQQYSHSKLWCREKAGANSQ